ncbi:MAG: DNA mismatch repair endonuclease MutL [Lachnospiraceae bacterium]|nr:DNA mismatch repair endonuclease MutL [Lachnospiraceae bacterium]
MALIQVLDQGTIDRIAAGEVIERPASVVKELLENALDAGAKSLSIEIRNGGLDLIRVTDDGSGIAYKEVRTAFLPHATSKLKSIDDLETLNSLGFRGEALPSIAAVADVELMTKTRDEVAGVRYCLKGGAEESFEEVGVPDGTTFLVKNLFSQVPARRKFLKSPGTEGSYVSALVEEMALSSPEVSFKYTLNGDQKLYTNGSGDLREVIYRIYGREFVNKLIPMEKDSDGMSLKGFIASPVVARNSRSLEKYFVNGRYVKDTIIARGLEEGYAGFLMQHKFPFCVLFLTVPSNFVDVNVHPRKMEVRFSDGQGVYAFVKKSVSETLSDREHIEEVGFGKEEKKKEKPPEYKEKSPEPFEKKEPSAPEKYVSIVKDEGPLYQYAKAGAVTSSGGGVWPPEKEGRVIQEDNLKAEAFAKPEYYKESTDSLQNAPLQERPPLQIDYAREDTSSEKGYGTTEDEKGQQLELFESRILSKEAASEYQLIGQVFDTYWLIEYRDELLLIDQHAAHEKVYYEKLMERFQNRTHESQILHPPRIVTLDAMQQNVLEKFNGVFQEMGFEIEHFGGNDYCIREVPLDLYGLTEDEIFTSLLDELKEGVELKDVHAIHDRIATMSCKAAIKGNMRKSPKEAKELITKLLSLNDPYHCPHGRPTVIRMSKYELEKKFKRVV